MLEERMSIMRKQWDERREEIRRLLTLATGPLTGNELAEKFAVTRQVIVQDMAVLRAGGEAIIATPNGYLLMRNFHQKFPYRVIISCHDTPERAELEMQTIVELGGRLQDIIIEHPVYGEITGQLRISTLEDVKQVLAKLSAAGSGFLSAATGGMHMHTIEADSEEKLDEIVSRLTELGFIEEDV